MKIISKSIIAATLMATSQSAVQAQQSLPGDRRISGKLVEAAFEQQRGVLQESSAAIYQGRKPIGFGAVMSADGYILTKNSELYDFDEKTKKDIPREIYVIVGETRYKKVKIVSQSPLWDLALLKIEAKDLKPITWAKSSDIAQGTWVVANGSTSKRRRRVNIGIISAKPRKIDGMLPVMMGVGLEKHEKGVKVGGVTPKSGAADAGVKKGDIITSFDGVEVKTRDEILDIIREKSPGDMVKVEILRKDKELKMDMELKDRKEILGAGGKPKSRNDQMSGAFSARRDSFPRVLQTDIGHMNRQAGGPLILLNGESIGICIARANRAESFVVPVEEALEVYKKLLNEAGK